MVKIFAHTSLGFVSFALFCFENKKPPAFTDGFGIIFMQKITAAP